MTLPKLAILLLRGLEGCGVTNYTRHLKAYYDSVGTPCEIFVLEEKKIGRADTSTDMAITRFSYANRSAIVSRINKDFDVSMVFSVPAKSFSEEVRCGYVEEILDKIKIKKWLVNLDHHVLSFTRNALYKSAIEACDGALCYSLNQTKSGFMGWLTKNDVNTTIQRIDNFFHIPFVSHLINLDRDPRQKRVIYAGRAVAWKRGSLLLNLHKPLAKRGFVSEMIGFERSIAGFSQFSNYEGKLDWFTTTEFEKPVKGPSAFSSSPINTRLFEFIDSAPQDPGLMYVMGSYDYKVGMKRVANSGFAIHPRSFEQNKLCYGNNFEFQGLEAVLLSASIFHRHFLDNVTLPGTTTKLSSTGVFFEVDDDNRHLRQGGPQVLEPEKFVDELDSMWTNPKAYRKRREESVELVKRYYASDVVVPKLMETLV